MRSFSVSTTKKITRANTSKGRIISANHLLDTEPNLTISGKLRIDLTYYVTYVDMTYYADSVYRFQQLLVNGFTPERLNNFEIKEKSVNDDGDDDERSAPLL